MAQFLSHGQPIDQGRFSTGRVVDQGMKKLEIGWVGVVGQVGMKVESKCGVCRAVGVWFRFNIKLNAKVGGSGISDVCRQSQHLAVAIWCPFDNDRALIKQYPQPSLQTRRAVKIGIVDGWNTGAGWVLSGGRCSNVDPRNCWRRQMRTIAGIDDHDGSLAGDRMQTQWAWAVVTGPGWVDSHWTAS